MKSSKEYCESVGKVWVEGHYRGRIWVHSYCRDRTYDEIEKMNPDEKREFEKKSPNLKGHYEGSSSDALDSIDEILRELDLPNNGGGEDFEYQDFEGNERNENEFDKNGGTFSTIIYKNGRYYNVYGAVNKNGKKWVASADIEEIEF